LTQKDRIEKLELDAQKLVEENTKWFVDVDKSLENIATTKKKGIYEQFFSRWFLKLFRKQNLQTVFSKPSVKNVLLTVLFNRP